MRNISIKKTIFMLGLLTVFIAYGYAQDPLFINEFMASNVLSISDEYGDYDDWIEIYNPNGYPVDMGGYYLSDDRLQMKKWQLPLDRPDLTIIPAQGYVILWMDGQTEQGPLHGSFKLTKEAETILFVETNGIHLIDHIDYDNQTTDISYGRYPDGSTEWGYMMKASPGDSNHMGYPGFAESPAIVQNSGFYESAITVAVNQFFSQDTVYYTLDGSIPTESSFQYSDPVPIDQTSILRARSFRAGFAPSKIVTKSFFISVQHTIPVISIVTDPINLFDDTMGIYSNPRKRGRAWERKVIFEYFDHGGLEFNMECGLRIQGDTGRSMPKKSFRLFFREGYGHGQLEHTLFPHTSVRSFENIVLRAGYDDDLMKYNGTLLRDPLATELWRRLGWLTSHSFFAILYLNGQLWGIYDIREHMNEHFVQNYLKYVDLDIIRMTKYDWTLHYGQTNPWEALLRFFETHDFDSDSLFAQASSLLDIDNFTSLQAFVHSTQFRSWVYGAFTFHGKQPDTPWQWTIWDMDRAFSDLTWNGFYYYDHLEPLYWINFIVQKLLQNQNYRHNFINRLSDLLNSLFLPDSVLPILDSLAVTIGPEIGNETDRWGSSVQNWQNDVDALRNFVQARPAIVHQQMMGYFNLSEPVRITLDIPGGGGRLRVNTLDVNTFPWSGDYFRGIPVEISAMPFEGHRFVGWSDTTLPVLPRVTIEPSNHYFLRATFEALEKNVTELVVPSRAVPGCLFPVVARIRDQEGNIDPLHDESMNIEAQNASIDTGFNIKKGIGSIVIPVEASSDFSITIENTNIPASSKIIYVDTDWATESYSGSMSAGEHVWDSQMIRQIIDDVVIPAGCRLTILPGTWVLLGKQVNLIVHGQLTVDGTLDDPVVFCSHDRTEPWGGLEFYNTTARFKYGFFINGGGDQEKGWAHTNRQPILFAKNDSQLFLDNCFILNSPGKALGSDHSRVNVSECLTAFVFHGGEFHYSLLHYKDSYMMNIPNDDGIFQDEDNDGFHIDYVYPNSEAFSVIESSYFLTGKDDAIDHHGARILITHCFIQDWMHEGIAASGNDTIKVFNTVVRDCEQGIETGFSGGGGLREPHVFVDHCVVINNDTGLRFGDNYGSSYHGRMVVTNTIVYNNTDNIRNYLRTTQAPYEGGIEITYSMTNDEDYDHFPACISGVPQFDEHNYLIPGSPGVGHGINGSNLGLIDSAALISGTVVINEIMYNSSEGWNSGDWIELFNPQSIPQDISKWILKDDRDDHSFQFENGTIISAKGYLVICENSMAFKNIHPHVPPLIGNLTFGFGRGDQVRLFSSIGECVDSLAYEPDDPWPSGADGHGPSLILKDYLLDNALAEHWAVSTQMGGTPFHQNDMDTGLKEGELHLPETFHLKQNYPNPFNHETRIPYHLPKPAKISMAIYNIQGQKIFDWSPQKRQPAGYHIITFHAKNYPTGLYFCHMDAKYTDETRHMQSIKLILIK